MKQKYVFSELDHKIISILREDGRAPFSKVATILGISRATIQTHVDSLIDSGAVLGFTLRVREDYEDSAIRAIMMIEVTGKSTTSVIKYLRGLPELYALHTTNGSWDLVAEIRAPSLNEFDRILREVRNVDGILNSETSILLSTI